MFQPLKQRCGLSLSEKFLPEHERGDGFATAAQFEDI